MEKEAKIKISGGKFLYGTLGIASKTADALIVFIHGFTGHQNEHIFFNGSKFFTEKEFDTFRFNLYGGEQKGSRHFRDVKISLHGEDITTVVKYFRKKYQKIFIIGHSYGGTSLLFTDQSIINGFVFWDASYIDWGKSDKEDLGYNKNLNAYVYDFGLEYMVGKGFIDELKNFPDCGKLIKQIHKPVLFIVSGRKGNAKAGKRYFNKANNPKKIINIKHADHCFDNWKDEELLFKGTYDWLKQNFNL